MGGVADPKIHAPPHMCYHVKFDSSATKWCMHKPPKLGSAGTQSHRKGYGSIRAATYDFLLKFYSKNGLISYRFRDKRRDFSRKSQIFPTFDVFDAP